MLETLLASLLRHASRNLTLHAILIHHHLGLRLSLLLLRLKLRLLVYVLLHRRLAFPTLLLQLFQLLMNLLLVLFLGVKCQ